MQNSTQGSSKIEAMFPEKNNIRPKIPSLVINPKIVKNSQKTQSSNASKKLQEEKFEISNQKPQSKLSSIYSEPTIDIYLMKKEIDSKTGNHKFAQKKLSDSTKSGANSTKTPSVLASNQSNKDTHNDSQKVKSKLTDDNIKNSHADESIQKTKNKQTSPKFKVGFSNEKLKKKKTEKVETEFGIAKDPFKVGDSLAKYHSENLKSSPTEPDTHFMNNSLKTGDKKKLMSKRNKDRASSSESIDSLDLNEKFPLPDYDIYKRRKDQNVMVSEKDSLKDSRGKKDIKPNDSRAKIGIDKPETASNRKNNSSVPTNKEQIESDNGLFKKLSPANFNMSGLIKESEPQTKLPSASINLSKVNFSNDRQALVSRIQQFYKSNSPSTKFQTTIDFYKIKEMVGKGRYGKVYLATHRLSDKNVAIKVSEKTDIKCLTAMQRIFEEANLLASLNHPNVIKLYEIFENEKYYFFVTEYMEKGDLMAILRANRRLEEASVFLILKDLVAVCKYLKSKRILHRDIKLDNILMDQYYRVNLCDFGISVRMRDEVLTEKCGTPAYMPPEVIAGSYSGFGFDVDSLELVCWCLSLYHVGRMSTVHWKRP